MKKSIKTGIFLAVLAATLYAVNAPLSKLLLAYMPATLMAGFLYLGAGLGMAGIALIRKTRKKGDIEAKLTKTELPYTIAMVLLDIAAPIEHIYKNNHLQRDGCFCGGPSETRTPDTLIKNQVLYRLS